MERLTPAVLKAVFPDANRVTAVKDNGPVAAAAYAGDELKGYIFSTLDVLRAPGYSATPFDVVAGVTLEGRITGATVLFHLEPYLLNDENRTQLLVQFLDSLKGREAKLGASGDLEPSFVAGATISARSMRNAILEGAQIVLRYRTAARVVSAPTIDLLNYRPANVRELIADGSLANALVTNADLRETMKRAGLDGLPLDVPARGGDSATYLDFWAGYALPPTIGRNMAGQAGYQRLLQSLPEGAHALIFGSSSVYDHLGSRYNNLSHGFRVERLSLTQGDRTYEFKKSDLLGVDEVLGRVANLIILPKESGFDPLRPWRADVYAYARKPDGSMERFQLASVNYDLPERYVLQPQAEARPAWMEAWVEGRWNIAILAVALVALTLILAFQSTLTRFRAAHRWVRLSFLTFTLVWLGWIASAQLSIVNLLNYMKAPFQGLSLGFYLAEPLIVIISIYTALSLVLLGRGVFCGWLCPFGALQELLAQIARALRLPQWNPAERIQQKLWNLKYVSLAVVVGLAFIAPDMGAAANEVEPFKTAITAMFVRGLPYVIYAVALLAIGLFTERAFCRFLCPLGAALAVLDRLHLLDLLKRRPECGNPCILCEKSCPVRAIERSGKIIMAECFQCLDCQVEYYDDQRCPPLSRQRKLRLRAGVPVRRPPSSPVPVMPRETA